MVGFESIGFIFSLSILAQIIIQIFESNFCIFQLFILSTVIILQVLEFKTNQLPEYCQFIIFCSHITGSIKFSVVDEIQSKSGTLK